MGLPDIPLRRETLRLEGATIWVQELSRQQTHDVVAAEGDLAQQEILLVSGGTGVSTADAAEWIRKTPSRLVDLVTQKVLQLSGLDPTVPGS